MKDGSTIFKVGDSLRVVRPCNQDWLKPKSNNATLPDGWTAYAVYQSSSPVTLFNGLWTVPSNPVQQALQTLFLFTGLQNYYDSNSQTSPQASTTIIQPVLQWGESEAGGGKNWYIASWYVGGGNAVYSELKQVAPNNQLIGNMTLTKGQWSIVTHDSKSGATSSLTVNTGSQELYAFVTLEVYGITACGDFPNGSTAFSKLVLDAGQPIKASWSPVTQNQCNEAVNIVDSSNIKIKY